MNSDARSCFANIKPVALEPGIATLKLLRQSALKRFILALIPLTLLCAVAFYNAFSLLTGVEEAEVASRTAAAIEIAKDQANHDFETVYGDLRFVASSERILQMLQHPERVEIRSQIERVLLNMAQTHSIYDQIRVLSATGMELIRVNYNAGHPRVVADEQLQNKANRYYFKEAMNVPDGRVYVSRLDLNVEHGEVERPYKPMIRFAIPIRTGNGQLLGVVVLNYLGESLLSNFRRQMSVLPGQSMLLNHDGYWLAHDQQEKEWGFMFNRNDTFSREYPKVWEQITSTPAGIIDNGPTRYVYETVRPLVVEKFAHQTDLNALEEWKIVVLRTPPSLNWSYLSEHLGYIYPLLIGYPIALIVLWFWSKAAAGRSFAEEDLKALNLSLEYQVIERTNELQATKDATIMSMASLAETRDNETGQHIRRTQHYIKTLAEELRAHPDFKRLLGDEAIQLIYKSAPLHDIGKVGIPDAILLKPGRLTADEFEIMKTHTTLGSDAIEEAINTLSSSLELDGAGTFLHYARDIAHYHHERWDGGGYPKGLCGDAIPLAARLMAIADVYDALVSERVYKPAFSRDRAEQIILDSEGQFDPRVLDAFKRCRDQFWQIKQRYREPVKS